MSNRKQQILKTRSTKKRANNWYPSTKRDWFLLERLESFGILSTQQIRELIFNGINTRTVLRRLRLLKKEGWLFSSEGLPNGGLIWVLTKKGASLFSSEGETRPINRNTLQHDITVSSVRIQLEKLNLAEGWIPEHVLKKQAIKFLYDWEKSIYQVEDPPIVPDGLFIAKNHFGEMKPIALEMELSLKSRARYKKLFSQYKDKKKLWCVWYVVLNKSAGETLLELWDKYALWGDCKFSYSVLEDVFKSDFLFPTPREAKERNTWS